MRVALLVVVSLLSGCDGCGGGAAATAAADDAGFLGDIAVGAGGQGGGSGGAAGAPQLADAAPADVSVDVAVAPSDAPLPPDAPDVDFAPRGADGPDDGPIGVVVDVGVDGREAGSGVGGLVPPVTAAFHQTLPLSSALLTTWSPTFGWTDVGAEDYFIFETCRDRACTDLIERAFSSLTTYSVTRTLDEGPVFWRVKAVLPGGSGILETPIAEVFIPPRSSAHDTTHLAFPDFNRDGHGDVAQAAAGGSVVVTSFDGNQAPLAAPQVLPGPARALAYGIDLNADGFGDLLVARPDAVDVYYGGNDGLNLVQTLTGGAGFGSGVVGVGDVNGDGFGDVIVATQPSAGAGSLALYLSGRRGLDKPRGALPAGHFGAAGDINADGYADVVVCAAATGTARLYTGGPAGLTAAGALVDPRPGAVGSFGNACQGVGDVNGDGFADVVVTGADQQLRAFLYLGGAGGLTPAADALDAGPAAGRSADETFVAGAGDVDRDGFGDVLITNGPVRLFRGGSNGLVTTAASTLAGEFRTAAAIADIDGDRVPDIVVGPRGCDQPAQIFSGAKGLGAGAIYRFENPPAPVCPQHLIAR
jgi:hypothetical protein